MLASCSASTKCSSGLRGSQCRSASSICPKRATSLHKFMRLTAWLGLRKCARPCTQRQAAYRPISNSSRETVARPREPCSRCPMLEQTRKANEANTLYRQRIIEVKRKLRAQIQDMPRRFAAMTARVEAQIEQIVRERAAGKMPVPSVEFAELDRVTD